MRLIRMILGDASVAIIVTSFFYEKIPKKIRTSIRISQPQIMAKKKFGQYLLFLVKNA